MKLKLGINTGFALNRYIEPEEWGRIVGDVLGLKSVQLTASLLNPFWDKDYLARQIRRIREASKKYGFTIDSIFTDAYTRVNHLSNPDRSARAMWIDWFKRLFDMGAQLGARSGGSHFGIQTFATYRDADMHRFIEDENIKGWQELSKHGKNIGFDCLIFEPMSIPREYANTVGETKRLMDRVNEDCGVPMRICLDVGHAPHPDERDCYPWIKALGKYSPVIHLQQTEINSSNHWAFTSEHNAQGYIKAEKVISCLKESGCEETLLILEIAHREHWDIDNMVIPDHIESVKYWRKFVED